MKIFIGQFIHSLSLDQLEIEKGVIVVNDDGIIIDIRKSIDDFANVLTELQSLYGDSNEITTLTDNQFLIPGFIDSHFHAPQMVNLGRGYDLTLLDWLEKYTFPRESDFTDINYAKDIYSKVVKRLLQHGTTTVSYFATIHLEATKVLADCMKEYGQRGYVGKVCMNINAPVNYIETHDACVSDNLALIKYLKDSTLVGPIITPRFAITCTTELLSSLGGIAYTHKLPIQSHLSENKSEIDFVHDLFPNRSYTQVYDDHRLLNEKTIMAHCIHLTDDEISLIKKREAGVSHCPTSNINLMSGSLDVKTLLAKGIKVGLGTDVSGGSSCSILRAINDALYVSKIIRKRDSINIAQAFYLATLGNAMVMNLDKKIGNFVIGKCFDALLIDTNISDGVMFLHNKSDDISDKFQKFIYTGDDRNIQKVFVNGKLVHKN